MDDRPGHRTRVILPILLVALSIMPVAATAGASEAECANRDHLEIRYELTLEASDGAAPKSGPVLFRHVVPGRSIQRIEIGTQTAEDSGERDQIPAIRISIARSDLEKIHALEASARQFAANEASSAPRTVSITGRGRLRSWGESTDLDRLHLEGPESREQLVQAVRAANIGLWLRAQLLCRGNEIPAEVSAAVERLLSKPSWNALDVTSDLHVLMTFEKPERGITAYDSDGSIYSDSYFRILGITWSTSVDPTGKARSAFHRSH